MSDYLLDEYNAKIAAALKAKDEAVDKATQIWLNDSLAASIELVTALERRNKLYVEGPPPEPEKEFEPESPPDTTCLEAAIRALPNAGDAWPVKSAQTAADGNGEAEATGEP